MRRSLARLLLMLIIPGGTAAAAEPEQSKRERAEAELNLASSYLDFIVDYDEALAEIADAISIDPTLADAYRLRAYVHLQQGKLDIALQDANQAVRLGPKQADCYAMRASLLRKAGQPKRAVADYGMSLQLGPERAWAYCGRGIARASLGNYANAIDDFKSAAEINPDLPDAALELGRLYATCPNASFRDGAEAIKLANRARELLGRDDCQVLDVLAAATAENGDFPAAVGWQQQAIDAATGVAPEAEVAQLRQRLTLYQSGKPFRGVLIVPTGKADKK